MRLLKRSTEDPLSAAEADRVRAILYLGGVPAGDLDDGVQEVRLKLLERQARDAERLRSVHAWVSVVASNIAADWHRKTAKDRRITSKLAEYVPAATHHPQEDATLAAAVARGLAELPPDQRQVLILRFYEDLPLKDIATALDLPIGTVKSRLHWAVKAVRERLRATEVI